MRLVDRRQLHQRRRDLDVRIGHFLVLLGHAIGAGGRLLQVRIVFGQELQFVLEEIVHIAHSGAQIDLVGCLAEAAHKAAEQVELLAWLGAQILIVLEEHLQVLVIAERWMSGQSR